MPAIDETARTAIEAETFRRLTSHLKGRSDVTNAQLMGLAGFCRNCLEGWYEDAAGAAGHTVTSGPAGEPMIADDAARTAVEAATYRRVRQHLLHDTPVQNIDLMNAAGFCRNCLANWYQEAAGARGVELSKDAAREIVYGMAYDAWRQANQRTANAEQLAAFEKARPRDH